MSARMCKIKGTGIFEQGIANFQIYPNPASDKFVVECEGAVFITLYDILGKEVLSQNVIGKAEINIRNLPNGVYNVRVLSEGNAVGNYKIVKN